MRLIDADELLNRLSRMEAESGTPTYRRALNDALHDFFPQIIKSIPTIDPYKHGEWIMRGGKLHCTKCDNLAPLKRGWEDGCTTYEYTESQWCPNCGAFMGDDFNGKK